MATMFPKTAAEGLLIESRIHCSLIAVDFFNGPATTAEKNRKMIARLDVAVEICRPRKSCRATRRRSSSSSNLTS